MFIFSNKKVIHNFFDKNKVFLYWYLTKYSGIPEKHYYLLMQCMVECMVQEIEYITRLNEVEQHTWIMQQVDDFAAEDVQ